MKFFSKDREFYKRVFTLALPIAAQSLISIGVNMLDTIMVGNLGKGETSALAATSLANSFITIYHILCMGLGMGASVLVSRYWGMIKAGDDTKNAYHSLKQTIALMMRLMLGLAALFALATAIIPEWIMRTYTDNPSLIELGTTYFRWSVITYFFLGTSLVTTLVLRSVGSVTPPLLISIGSLIINLLGNYTFIFGHFGAPRLEIAGAALGTLIARLFEATAILIYLFIIDKKIRFKPIDLFVKCGTLIKEYLKICIPVLISDGILAVGTNTVAMVIGHLGDNFVSANAVTAVTQQLSTAVVQGVSQAGAIVTGQTLGEGNKEKTMKHGYLFFGLGIGLGIVSAIFITIAKNPIISAYKDLSEEAVNIAQQLMWAISLIIIFQATNSIMTKGVLRGGGDTKMLMITDNIFLWAISIPLGILAGFVLHLPPFWIFVCLKSDQIIKTFWALLRLRSGKWIKKVSTSKNNAAPKSAT